MNVFALRCKLLKWTGSSSTSNDGKHLVVPVDRLSLHSQWPVLFMVVIVALNLQRSRRSRTAEIFVSAFEYVVVRMIGGNLRRCLVLRR
jgi:hypothetical protein